MSVCSGRDIRVGSGFMKKANGLRCLKQSDLAASDIF